MSSNFVVAMLCIIAILTRNSMFVAIFSASVEAQEETLSQPAADEACSWSELAEFTILNMFLLAELLIATFLNEVSIFVLLITFFKLNLMGFPPKLGMIRVIWRRLRVYFLYKLKISSQNQN